jgi:hypothetical protein
MKLRAKGYFPHLWVGLSFRVLEWLLLRGFGIEVFPIGKSLNLWTRDFLKGKEIMNVAI